MSVPTASAAPVGTLVLVMGPSGAGKDSLINQARVVLSDDPRFVFARRTVTRPSSQWEEHDVLDPASFAQAQAEGRFALVWHAHGLHYGIDSSIKPAIALGKIVICNVSRGIVAQARARFAKVHAIFIDASPVVLAARLAARGREPEIDSRTGRGRPVLQHAECDCVIDNSGELAVAVAAFIAALRHVAAG